MSSSAVCPFFNKQRTAELNHIIVTVCVCVCVCVSVYAPISACVRSKKKHSKMVTKLFLHRFDHRSVFCSLWSFAAIAFKLEALTYNTCFACLSENADSLILKKIQFFSVNITHTLLFLLSPCVHEVEKKLLCVEIFYWSCRCIFASICSSWTESATTCIFCHWSELIKIKSCSCDIYLESTTYSECQRKDTDLTDLTDLLLISLGVASFERMMEAAWHPLVSPATCWWIIAPFWFQVVWVNL